LTVGHTVAVGPQWAYQIKHDGYRFICRREGDRVRVFSRRGNELAESPDLLPPVTFVTYVGYGEGIPMLVGRPAAWPSCRVINVRRRAAGYTSRPPAHGSTMALRLLLIGLLTLNLLACG
jgi:ATP dependent DNA ligase domain